MRRKLKWFVLFCFFYLLLGCTDALDTSESITKQVKEAPNKLVTIDEKEVVDIGLTERQVTLSAVGDILIHARVYNDAKVKEGYDFMPMLEHVEQYLNDTTVTFANQETMIGGESIGLSTYPSFNSPYEIGDALKEVGVNVVSIANNHTLDRGEKAIQSAIEHWEQIDMMYTGAYKSQADQDELRIFNTDEGISIAFLAYTYGTNGIPTPEGKGFLINRIEQESIAAEIEEAKDQADVIILSLHFGNEYERMPSEEQKDLVQFVADQGVHAVLGHHPHVLQPVEWVKGEEGNEMFVAYSLGNFLSGQDKFYRRIGGILKLTINQTIQGNQETIEITEPKFMPTYVKFQDETNYEVVPMYQLSDVELPNIDTHYEGIQTHMTQWMPELEFIE